MLQRFVVVPRKYRIGVILDDLHAPKWVLDLCTWVRANPAIELAALVIAPLRPAGVGDTLLKLEQAVLGLSASYRSHASTYSIAGLAPVQLFLHPQPCDGAGGFGLGADEAAKLSEIRLDLLIQCGRAIPTGAVLDSAKDGVVSVIAGQDRSRNPRGAAFSEVLEGRPETAFTIERLRHGAETGELLFRGTVATAFLHSTNLLSVHARALPHLQATVERLARGEIATIHASEASETEPCPTGLLSYGVRTAHRTLQKAVRRCARREFNWKIAFVRQPWWNCDFADGIAIENPPNAFLADPFTIKVGGIDYLFAEEFPYETRKGVISAYRIEGNKAVRIGVVLEEDYHLSFPYLFEHSGEIYLIPESASGGSVKLYKSVRFPDVWAEAKVLMSDVRAVDTIIFAQGSLWWMLTTIQGTGPGLNNAELHAFHATDPLGEWTAHRSNPIVVDARKGRNGGFLRDEQGRPCRVAQRPGFTFYGAGSAIYRIDEISRETYSESLVKEVRPDFFPALDGTHHIHAGEGITVFDFMRVERPRVSRAA